MNPRIVALLMLLFKYSHAASRQKRFPLAFPQPTSNIQYLAGFGLPITVGHNSLTMGAYIKSVYNLPTNGSYYTLGGLFYQKREIRVPSRFEVYSIAEKLIERVSELDGKVCLLRAICETARFPIHNKGWWIGDLLHIFLTPSTSEEARLSADGRDYVAAEKMGSSAASDDCSALYDECPTSLPDLISRLV